MSDPKKRKDPRVLVGEFLRFLQREGYPLYICYMNDVQNKITKIVSGLVCAVYEEEVIIEMCLDGKQPHYFRHVYIHPLQISYTTHFTTNFKDIFSLLMTWSLWQENARKMLFFYEQEQTMIKNLFPPVLSSIIMGYIHGNFDREMDKYKSADLEKESTS